MSEPASRRLGLLAALALLCSGLVVVIAAAPALADPCGPGGNEIACENAKPGSPPSEWDDVWGAGDPSIQGFATKMSVQAGEEIRFKVDSESSAYTVDVYRTGWYGGDGARHIAELSPGPANQPTCISDLATELYDCGNWAVSSTWNVPATAVSGVYLAVLEIPATGARSHITFVVRDDDSGSDVVFQTSDPTWQAYNSYGGSNLYWGGGNGRAYKVSYNRPTPSHGRDFYFGNEYALVRFLERNGYDVSYISGIDTHRDASLLLDHEVFLSVGHDEYWSGDQRANVEAARDAGVDLQFLSGNEVYWRTRYEPSADNSRTPLRTLVTYKETWAGAKIDPAEEWTGTWRDPRFAPRSQGGGMPEHALTGQMYFVNDDDLALTVSEMEGKLRLWRHTPLASLPNGGSATLAPHTVGYESDELREDPLSPDGLIRLSTTVGPTPQYLTDFGTTVVPHTTKHHLTMYRASSGALVFAAGTIQWTWGLDDYHDTPYPEEPADPRMQQAQVNLLADMGAQPTTLMPDLTAATATTDTVGPTVSITSPDAGASRPNGDLTTVTGTATDTGGGRVAGVQVSTDDGESWQTAEGTATWTHSYHQRGFGSSTSVLVRAVDDSANIGPVVTRSIDVTCPCSVFGGSEPAFPATLSADDPSAAELGLRFSPNSDGFVSGVRFYKGAGNTGTHTGSLWSASGERLASVTFEDETETGWQSATFSNAVPVAAGQTYVVSYTAPNGHYAVQPWAFSERPLDAPPLAVQGGYGAAPAGVYSSAGYFPSLSHQHANYFVDVLFTTTDESPLTAASHWPLPDSSSVPADTTVSARFSKPVVESSIDVSLVASDGTTVAGATSYDATTRTVTFTPSDPLDGFVNYTATLSARDNLDNEVAHGDTWSFTTVRPPGTPGVCPCTLFDDAEVPSVLEAADANAVTLGVRFTADTDGSVTAVRFYKGPNNTGSHSGALWSANGTLLAEGTFTDESTSGWQTLTFPTPVAIEKDVEYVASYRTQVGRYSVTPNEFAQTDLSRSPLHVTSTAGAYTYGAGFPANSSSSNYLVDVDFEKATPTLTVTSQSPPPGSTDIPRDTPVRIGFSTPLAPGWSMSVTDQTAEAPIAGNATISDDRTRLTFTPSDLLPADSDIGVEVSGLVSAEGVTLETQTWTFRSRGPDSSTAQSLFSDQVPQSTENDSSPVELGTVFSPTRDGQVTGIRFFKATGNDGTHVGTLWAADGTQLARVTFQGESATGWQSATVSPAVPVTAGTTYVVSYLAPQGHYSYTPGFFSTEFSSGNLTAPAGNNGRYLYGAGGGFPTYSFNATNYFVDVVFERAPATIEVTGRTPASDATDVSRTVAPSLNVSAEVADGYAMTATHDGTPLPGTASLSADRKTIRFTPDADLPGDADVTVSVTGVVSTEGAALPDQTWTFHTQPATVVASTLFESSTPATPAVGDSSAVEVGTVFTPSVDGSATAIRFYKGSGNTGTHVGSIWAMTGERLATVTFSGETASGWQIAHLDSPLSLTAGTSYVVSYYAPNGHYSATGGYFSSEQTSGALTMPAGTNGRYRYGAGGGFPTASWNSTAYFADVVFETEPVDDDSGGVTVGSLTIGPLSLLGR